MSDPSLPLQAEIVARLKAASPLVALVSDRIYDEPPANPTFPYVTLGPAQVLPDKAQCIDGVEVFPQIDVWSRTMGFPEAKRIAAAIVTAIDDATLNIAGFEFVLFELQDINYLRDPDGKTSHAALTFHALIQV